MHKPGSLWPPPSADITTDIPARLRMVANKDAMHRRDGYEKLSHMLGADSNAPSSSTFRIRAPTSNGGTGHQLPSSNLTQ